MQKVLQSKNINKNELSFSFFLSFTFWFLVFVLFGFLGFFYLYLFFFFYFLFLKFTMAALGHHRTVTLSLSYRIKLLNVALGYIFPMHREYSEFFDL